MNSFSNDLFTFDNFLSPKDSINIEPKVQKKSIGHYSLFSGYQEVNGQKTDFSVDEINRKQKLYVSDSKSSSRSPTPPRVTTMFNLSDISKSNNLPPVTNLVLVEDIINNTIPDDSTPQLLNIKVMVVTSHKLINKLNEKKQKLLKRVSSPTQKKIIKKQIKSQIKKVQAKTTKEISKVSSPRMQKKLKKAEKLIKKLQPKSSPSSSRESSPKVKKSSSPKSSPKVKKSSSPKSSPKVKKSLVKQVVKPVTTSEDDNELLKKINKQLMQLQNEVKDKIKDIK
jgi:hypothetical protein